MTALRDDIVAAAGRLTRILAARREHEAENAEALEAIDDLAQALCEWRGLRVNLVTSPINRGLSSDELSRNRGLTPVELELARGTASVLMRGISPDTPGGEVVLTDANGGGIVAARVRRLWSRLHPERASADARSSEQAS